MTKREVLYVAAYFGVMAFYIINDKCNLWVDDALAYGIEMFGLAIPVLSFFLGMVLGGKVWRWFVPFGTGLTEMMMMIIINEELGGNLFWYFVMAFLPAVLGVILGRIRFLLHRRRTKKQEMREIERRYAEEDARKREQAEQAARAKEIEAFEAESRAASLEEKYASYRRK